MRILFVIAAICLGMWFLGPYLPHLSRECVNSGIVESVGGCDRYGYCGVKLTDGRFDNIRYPVIGREHCLRYVGHWETK